MDILACNAGLALGQDQTEPQFTEDGQGLGGDMGHGGNDGIFDVELWDIMGSS